MSPPTDAPVRDREPAPCRASRAARRRLDVEAAFPDLAPCLAPPPPSWADLKSRIRSTGRFDRALILDIALRRARIEQRAFETMGLPQPWPTLFAHEFRLTWQVAKAAMDGLVAERIRQQLFSNERDARALELRAEVLTSSIPPRHAEAADLRAQASEIRAGKTDRMKPPSARQIRDC